MGAAVSVFDAAGAIRVPRTRFAPVKNTNDLLAVRSDCYVLDDRFQVVPNPERSVDPIVINLDPRYWKLIDDFENRFPFGAPSLVDCVSLTVKGDFKFGSSVRLEGCVTLINDKAKAFEIEDRRIIQGELQV
jgi:UTP--glucose-1-phosphate uridylyltransferase